MSSNRLPSAKSLRLQLGWNSVLTVVLALALCVGANYLGYRFYKRHDYSKGAMNTLSGKTLSVLSGLQEPVTITTSLLTSEMGGQIETLLREYKYGAKGKVKLEIVNPAVNLSRAEELKAKYSLDPSQENVVVFEYKDRHKVVSESELADYAPGNPYTGQPGQMIAFKGEAVFTAAILSLVEGKSAKVYFLLGHGERDLADVSNLGGIGGLDVYLKRDNLVTAPLNLADKGAVPDDADALVIVGPRVALSPAEVQAVSTYLDGKGKVVLLQDPKIVSGLEPVAQRYGIVIQDDRVQAVMKMGGASLLVRTAVANDYAAHPAVNAIKGLNLKMDNARSIALAPAKDASTATASKVTALVRTSAAYWGETSPDDSKPQFDEGVDIRGPLTLAMVYDGGDVPGDGVKLAGTRFAVIGSSTFLTNEKLDGTGLDFFQGLLDWMLKKDLAIGIAPKSTQDFGLNVSPLQKSTIITFALFLAPGIAVLGGIGVWFARRR